MGIEENNIFKSTLLKLSKDLIVMVSNGTFPKETKEYTIYNVNELEFFSRGVKALSLKIERDNREVLKDDRAIILNQIVTKTNNYITCLDIINIYYIQEIDNSVYWLNSFCNYTLNNVFNKHDDSTLENWAISFINYLDDIVERKVKIFISGLDLQGVTGDKSFSINNSISLRLPRTDDVKLETSNTFFDLYLYKPFSVLQMSTAVIEFSSPQKSANLVADEINLTINIFRLYKRQSIIVLYYSMDPEIVFQSDGIHWSNRNENAVYMGNFNQEDAEKLNYYFNKFKLILVPYLNYQSGGKYTYRLGSALERYKEALITGVDVDSRITLVISSLELLYKIGDSEIPYRVRLYASAFLKIVGFNPNSVYNDLESAYNIRNAVAHGSKERKDLNSTEKELLCERILEYNRISLIIFLQLTKEEREELLNKQLNKSLFEATITSNIIDMLSNTDENTNKRIMEFKDIRNIVDKNMLVN